MAWLQELTPGEARRFRTGRPCLDLAHTGGDGRYAALELFHTPGDVARWLRVIAELDDIETAAGDVPAARELRRAVWNGAHSLVAGKQVTDRDRVTLNHAAQHPAPVPVLTRAGVTVRRPLTAAQVLSLLARDAIDLFASPLAGRIRVCSAPDCALLYVDRSRTGNRRWCSMQRCGTLAKVRAHRAQTD